MAYRNLRPSVVRNNDIINNRGSISNKHEHKNRRKRRSCKGYILVDLDQGEPLLFITPESHSFLGRLHTLLGNCLIHAKNSTTTDQSRGTENSLQVSSIERLRKNFFIFFPEGDRIGCVGLAYRLLILLTLVWAGQVKTMSDGASSTGIEARYVGLEERRIIFNS